MKAGEPFSHIYIEEQVKDYPRTRRILEHFPNRQVVEIRHYKDVFNRKRQNISLQHSSPNLILAAKTQEKSGWLYPGAPVCQSFGSEHFFYTSCVMNCLFDCKYCYLKGMYPSGNLVIFVNLEELFREVEQKLCDCGDLYLCISYDTDLLALEGVTGFVEEWIRFTQCHPGLTIEVRTKSASTALIQRMPVCDRVIFAYTLSPEKLIRSCEPGAGSLKGRWKAAKLCLERGVPTRLCFDPILFAADWEKLYRELIEETAEALPMEKVRDFSVGTFRVSADFIKQMRKNYPETEVIWYPFARVRGYCQYSPRLADKMEKFVTEQIRFYCPTAEIFRWEE